MSNDALPAAGTTSNAFKRGAVAKAAALIMGSTYITYALGLLIGAVIARALGPTSYGKYAFVVWLSGWLVLVANNGLNASGIRFISDTLGRGAFETARNIHGWLLRWQRISTGAVAAALISVSIWLAPESWGAQLPLFVTVLLAGFAARAAYLFDVSIAKGYGAFHVEAYSMLVVTTVSMIGVILLAFLHAPLAAYLVLFAAGSVGLWLYAGFALRRCGIRPAPGGLDAAMGPEVKRHLMWTILLISSGSIGAKSIDTFLLNALIGPREIGFFTIAISLTRGGTDLLTAGLSTVLMPAMGRAFGEGGHARVNRILSEAVIFFAFFGLVLAGVGYLWSGPVIALLYGHEYTPVIPALQILMIVGGVTLLEGAFGSVLSTTGRQSVWAGVTVAWLLLSVVLAFSLIPRFGFMGAVLSYSAGRLAVVTALVISVTRLQKLRLPSSQLLRLMMSSVLGLWVALPMLWLFPGVAGQLIAGVLYLAVFSVATAPFGVWTRAHVDLVQSALTRVPSVLKWSRPVLEIWRERYAR